MTKVLLLVLITLFITLPALADYCQYECTELGDPCAPEHWQYICHPEYYTAMTIEPDWCLYSAGDRVYLKYSGVPGQIIGWYVVSSCDTSQPPAGFDPNPWWVEPTCVISPWAYC
jgi:hypothetical protein